MDFQLLADASLVVMTLVRTVTGDAGATSVTGARLRCGSHLLPRDPVIDANPHDLLTCPHASPPQAPGVPTGPRLSALPPARGDR